MGLSQRQIARLAHEAVRNRKLIVAMGKGQPEKAARGEGPQAWHMLQGVHQDTAIEWVQAAIETQAASPAAFYDKAQGRYSQRRFDVLSTDEQYEIFLFRSIVLSQINWDEEQVARQGKT